MENLKKLEAELANAELAITEFYRNQLDPIAWQFEQMKFKVEFNSLSSNEITIVITDDEHHWASDLIRVYIRTPYGEKNFQPTFNYGSGGWRDGFPPADLLLIFQTALKMAETAIRHTLDYQNHLREMLQKRNKLAKQVYLIHEERIVKEAAIKHQNTLKEAKKFMKLHFKPILKQEIIDQLLDVGPDNSTYINFVQLSASTNGTFRVNSRTASADRYGHRAVYRFDNNRISRKKFDELNLDNLYIAPSDYDWRLLDRSMTIEQAKEIITKEV